MISNDSDEWVLTMSREEAASLRMLVLTSVRAGEMAGHHFGARSLEFLAQLNHQLPETPN